MNITQSRKIVNAILRVAQKRQSKSEAGKKYLKYIKKHWKNNEFIINKINEFEKIVDMIGW